jgi:hypothetical protein
MPLRRLHTGTLDNSVASSDSLDDTVLPYAQTIAVNNGVSAAAISNTLYLTEPGDSLAISVHDIHQGALGDCFLLSAIGELALFYPSLISSMITASSSTTETVTLYDAYNTGSGPGPRHHPSSPSFKAVSVTVDNSTFSPRGVNSAFAYSQNIVGNQQEIWPQVLEAAYAIKHGGYNAIANGGYPARALEELTGHAATSISTTHLSSATISTLISDIAAGDLLVFDTANVSGLPYGLVRNHAYMFESLNTTNNTVQLLNPWGFNNPAPIPLANLAQAGIVEVDVGYVSATSTVGRSPTVNHA